MVKEDTTLQPEKTSEPETTNASVATDIPQEKERIASIRRQRVEELTVLEAKQSRFQKQTYAIGWVFFVVLVLLSLTAMGAIIWGSLQSPKPSIPAKSSFPWQWALLAGVLILVGYFVPLLIARISRSGHNRTEKKTVPVRDRIA